MADNDKSTEKIEEKGGISVQTEHIFPIIKKWLYSEKEIFLREIVSNASDAVTKLRRLISLGEVHDIDDDGFKITVTVDKAAGTLTVSDNGIGMTEEQCREILRKEPGDRTGIGIKNVNDRIKIYFGSNYGLNITSELDEGTCVTIRMPKVREEEYEKK